ncbi:tetratricopeptide repeat protein 23-like isoform X2 [Phascolarctos cinereus]|uniref:Tetratricopeptide repeat protein 23-like isoform X2 n=1 Tax=Phascolarctos cinereus TaxID=38626 RepID=A0A6P5L371_PHACI|nr:tetratricopeptide repeat protein 23-like isoform X2 [Phascolarctos cinereus]
MEWDLPLVKNLWEKETRTLVAEQRSESNPSDEFGDSEDKENETDKVARNADYMSIPKEKLNKSQRKAELLIKAKKNCQANQELIRCVTFSRIVFGTEHWRYAQALTNLAYGYLTLRELPAQAKQHAESAKNSLLTWKGSEISDIDKKEILGTLVTLYYTLGVSDLMQNHGKEAYYNLQKSEKSMEELWECHEGQAIVRDLKVSEKDLIIALGRAALQLHRLNLSVNYFEKAITHVISSKGDSTSELISLYQEAAQVEQLRKNHDRAIEHLLQAHSICVASYKELSAEAAKTGFLLAKAYAMSGEPQHKDAAELYFTNSLKAYQTALGPDNYYTLCATEEFSKWLLQIGEKQEAYKLLKNSLKSQLMSYGDYSEKVAETFYILGSICLAKGEIKKTTQLLRKCLEIQILIYGTDHKKTRETQKLLTLLQRSSGIIEKENRQDRQK